MRNPVVRLDGWDVVRNALIRVVASRDAMEDGDNRLAEAILYDLEVDLDIALEIAVQYGVAA